MNVNEEVGHSLYHIINKYGGRIIEDARRCEGLLRDLCGDHRREISVLIVALKERVPSDLLHASRMVPREVLLASLSRRLVDNCGLDREFALWAVDCWDTALGTALTGDSTSRVCARGGVLDLVVARNEDSRLEVFHIRADYSIWQNWQTEPDGAWHGEEHLVGRAKQIAVGQNADGRLELFYVGADDSIWHNWQTVPNGVWHGEEPLVGRAKQIAVGENEDGRLEIFYVGMDDSIWQNWQTEPNGVWHGEQAMEGRAKQIAVKQNADGRLEIFYVGMDGAIWHNWQTEPNGVWHGEKPLVGRAMYSAAPREARAKQIVVGQNDNGRLEIFYLCTDGTIWHNWQIAPNGVWHGERPLRGRAKQIAVSNKRNGRLIAFYVATSELWSVGDNLLSCEWQLQPGREGASFAVKNGQSGRIAIEEQLASLNIWGNTETLGVGAKRVAVGQTANGRLAVFFVGLDDSIWHDYENADESEEFEIAWRGPTKMQSY